MNVFVLTTGRTGSLTFYKACKYLSNFTVGHETKKSILGKERFAFPSRHIEIDNRICWKLGLLDRIYGDNAVYVHLVRNMNSVAISHHARWDHAGSIAQTYATGIIGTQTNSLDVQIDMVETVNLNIEHFLKDKSSVFRIDIDDPIKSFTHFWTFIEGKGDINLAIKEFSSCYNKTNTDIVVKKKNQSILDRLLAFLRGH